MKRAVPLIRVKIAAAVLIFCLSCVLAIGKYRDNQCNYLNSDATWHVLLTMTAYEETPGEVHHYLPIVSLGEPDDKNIPWGRTIPDRDGNYYYTSFSSAGFVAPYLFLKLLGLPFSESGLYLFNSVLYCVSDVLLLLLLMSLFGSSVRGIACSAAAVFLYGTSPIVLHGMGIVYWHHSIMQCTLLLQLLMYGKKEEAKGYKWVFLTLCLVNPYIEWTGYVANGGFVLAELLNGRAGSGREKRRGALRNSLSIILLTGAALAFYCLQYCAVVTPQTFLQTVLDRFAARSVSSAHVSPIKLIHSYLASFFLLWLVLLALFVVLLVTHKGVSWLSESVLWNRKTLLFLVSFPLMENLIMMEHAATYPYDQMKAGFLLALLACDWMVLTLNSIGRKHVRRAALIALVSVGVMNYASYCLNADYRWDIGYREDNQRLSEYINAHYGDSVIGTNSKVRGYANLLFHRGIYELEGQEELRERAEENAMRYAVWLENGVEMPWDMNRYFGARITDCSSGEEFTVSVSNGIIRNQREEKIGGN